MNYHDDSFTTHQPRTVYEAGKGTMNHFWDANGNLSQTVDCKTGAASINFWDEENRLRLAVNPKYAGYYGYDANGERVYKLTGSTQYDDLNGSNPSFGIIFDGLTVYPSPYIVLTEKQYTKHYYAGTEKIATMIGDGGLLLEANHISNEQRSLIKDGFYRSFEPTAFQYEKTMNMDIEGKHQSQLEYACGYIDHANLYLMSNYPMLEPMMQIWQNSNGCKNEIYYTHGDHLGSASWITNAGGKPIQYIHYAPYGEQIANQQTIGYDERFKFTGKERDAETGYDYFGARFYWSADGIFTTVDPLADKYPGNTPYLYCNGNPIMLVDPDGRDVFTINEENGTIERVHTEGNNHSYYLTNGVNTSYVGSFQQNENGLVGLSGTIAFNNTSGEACSFSIKDGNESRSFISPNALASLIGAVGSTGYTDVSVVGFSLSDGSSPSPSISHKNGNVGDLRYLRTDGVSAPVLVNGKNFDTQRNEALTSALHKFGWKDMISERVGGYLLPNTSSASERGIRTNHTNHLHIQGYRPSIVETYMGGNLTDIIVYGKRL